jgi:putative FmdB family regulatory protein
MPLREYECQACHRRIEKIKSFSAPPETVCPHCGGELHQTLSAPAVQFKGSGWYVSDYARAGSTKKSADSAKDSSGDSGKRDSGSADVSASAEKSAAKDSAGSSTAPESSTASAKTTGAAASSSSSAKSD